MVSICGVDKLGRNTDAIPCTTHAALKDRANIEGFGNLTDVLFLPAKREGGCAGRDLQSRDMGQCVNDLFGEAVAEILVLFVRAQVRKRQDGDGGFETGSV